MKTKRRYTSSGFTLSDEVVVIAVIAFLVIAALGGCRGHSTSSTSAPRRELTVAAAADLQGAFAEIAQAFEHETDCRVVLAFGSTGQLAQQIEQGFPADIFAAANVSYLDALRTKNLVIADSQQLYARGRIVLVTRKDSAQHVKELQDLLDSEVRHVAIANPGHAPYGLAARQALERVGIWSRLQPKIVLGENVRQALQYVETGNADAGIVALSVARSPELEGTLIDDSLHEPLDQALAIVASTKQERLAREFIAFLNSPPGRSIMAKFGFVLPEELHEVNLDLEPGPK